MTGLVRHELVPTAFQADPSTYKHIPLVPLNAKEKMNEPPKKQEKKITFAKWIVFHPLNECDTFFASGIHTEGL